MKDAPGRNSGGCEAAGWVCRCFGGLGHRLRQENKAFKLVRDTFSRAERPRSRPEAGPHQQAVQVPSTELHCSIWALQTGKDQSGEGGVPGPLWTAWTLTGSLPCIRS